MARPRIHPLPGSATISETEMVEVVEEIREATPALDSDGSGGEFFTQGQTPKEELELIRKTNQDIAKRLHEARVQQAKEMIARAHNQHLGRAPAVTQTRSMRPDPTALPPGIKREPGYTYKWEPPLDAQGDSDGSGGRINLRLSEGFEVVRDPSSGKLVRGPYGVLLKITPENLVEREKMFAVLGSHSPEQFFVAQAELETLNAKFGGNAIRAEQQKSMGSFTREESFSPYE